MLCTSRPVSVAGKSMLVHGLHPCSDVPRAARLPRAVPAHVGRGFKSVRYASDLSAGTRTVQQDTLPARTVKQHAAAQDGTAGEWEVVETTDVPDWEEMLSNSAHLFSSAVIASHTGSRWSLHRPAGQLALIGVL